LYLDVKNITVCFDTAMVLNKVSLNVNKGEFVTLVGPNGAGKSTLFRAIAGLIKWEKETLKGTKSGRIILEGNVSFNGEEVFGLPAHEIAKRGLILSPERGRPFREMTVQKNLIAAAYLSKDRKEIKTNLDKVYDLFPVLKDRVNQTSGTLSGGELTMLAIGRSLMSQANLMLVDEPSTGLAPKIKNNLFSRLKEVHDLGITILMAEQDIGYAFDLSTRNYVISQGKVIAEGSGDQLMADDMLRETYLGL
jgi:branched-chain amino acid transport system ATP-binding protein